MAMMVSPLINFAPIRESHNVLLAQLRAIHFRKRFPWVMSLDLDLWGRCLPHRNNDNLSLTDGDTERDISSSFFSGWSLFRLEPVLYGRTIIRVMVGVGTKNSGKGKCSPKKFMQRMGPLFHIKTGMHLCQSSQPVLICFFRCRGGGSHSLN